MEKERGETPTSAHPRQQRLTHLRAGAGAGTKGTGRGKPRKSLPAAFFVPATTRETTRTRKDALSFGGLEGEGEDDAQSPEEAPCRSCMRKLGSGWARACGGPGGATCT